MFRAQRSSCADVVDVDMVAVRWCGRRLPSWFTNARPWLFRWRVGSNLDNVELRGVEAECFTDCVTNRIGGGPSAADEHSRVSSPHRDHTRDTINVKSLNVDPRGVRTQGRRRTCESAGIHSSQT